MTLLLIVVFGLLMSAIALVGGLTAALPAATLQKVLLPLVALAAGSLVGGALFHLLPEAHARLGPGLSAELWLAGGFVLFFVLEQLLHWHHCHRPEHASDPACGEMGRAAPATYLILAADALHNLIGGIAVGAAFTLDLSLGITAWLVAAAH